MMVNGSHTDGEAARVEYRAGDIASLCIHILERMYRAHSVFVPITAPKVNVVLMEDLR